MNRKIVLFFLLGMFLNAVAWAPVWLNLEHSFSSEVMLSMMLTNIGSVIIGICLPQIISMITKPVMEN